MKLIYLILLISTIFISSCDDEHNEFPDIEGTYEGTFIRSSPNSRYETSEVTLIFSNGQFHGESEKIKYPAICNGTYEVRGSTVEFFNSCVWTAEFDWTLILSGEFSIELKAGELTLQRRLGNISDLYQLKLK